MSLRDKSNKFFASPPRKESIKREQINTDTVLWANQSSTIIVEDLEKCLELIKIGEEKILTKKEEFGEYSKKVKDKAIGCDFYDMIYLIVTIFIIGAFAASIYMGAKGFHGFFIVSGVF